MLSKYCILLFVPEDPVHWQVFSTEAEKDRDSTKLCIGRKHKALRIGILSFHSQRS